MDDGSQPRDGRADGRRPDEEKDDEYDSKFKDLQKYVPFLKSTIRKLEMSADKVRDAQLNKMKNLYSILSNPKRRLKIDTLERCEEVLKKLEEKLKSPLLPEAPPNSRLRVETEENVESPASPPQADHLIPKPVPKLIPVERCATVERDFSKVKENSLEVSRERLKGLMVSQLSKDPFAPPPVREDTVGSLSKPSAAHIPGLDMVFPSAQESRADVIPFKANSSETAKLNTVARTERSFDAREASNVQTDVRCERRDMAVRDVLKLDSDSRFEKRNVDPRNQMIRSEEWQAFDDRGRTHINRDVPDERIANKSLGDKQQWRDIDERLAAPRDVDERRAPMGSELPRNRMGALQSQVHAPSYPSSISNRQGLAPSLLPRHVPTHPPAAAQFPNSPQSSGWYNEQSRAPVPPSNSYQHSASHKVDIDARSNALSIREKLGQSFDKIEKLGVSTGGALRALKTDPRIARREDSERRLSQTESVLPEDANHRMREPIHRNLQPQESERRSSTEAMPPRLRLDHPIPREVPDASPVHSSSSQSLSSPYDPRTSTPVVMSQNKTAVYHNQKNVVQISSQTVVKNTYQWQATCTVKQTTAHDLGYRYQRKEKRGQLGYHDGHGGAPYWQGDDSSVNKDLALHRKDSDIAPGAGRRLADPRLPSLMDDKRMFDPRRGERFRDSRSQKCEDLASPLGSLYNRDQLAKTGPGYGVQNYRIPRIRKEPSPVKETDHHKVTPAKDTIHHLAAPAKETGLQPAVSAAASATTPAALERPCDPRRLSSRDPRMAKAVSRPPSPDISKAVENASYEEQELIESRRQDHQSAEGPQRSPSPSVRNEGIARSGGRSPDRNRSRGRSPDRARGRSRSPSESRERSRGRSTSRSRRRSRDRSASRSRGKSRARSRVRSPYRSKSRARSPSRSRGRSRGRSSSRSRGRSRGRSSSHSRARSRGRSSSQSRARSRGRSRSSSRRRSRDRERVRSRGRSRARSRANSSDSGSQDRKRESVSPDRRRRSRAKSRSLSVSSGTSTGSRSEHSSRSRKRKSREYTRSRGKSRSRRSRSHSKERSVYKSRSRRSVSSSRSSSASAVTESKSRSHKSGNQDSHRGRSRSRSLTNVNDTQVHGKEKTEVESSTCHVSSESAMDVPSSTSESLPASKSEVVSSSDVFESQKPSQSSQHKPETSTDDLLMQILRKALQDQEGQKVLLEFAAKDLPEDKREKVMEIFKSAGAVQESKTVVKDTTSSSNEDTSAEKEVPALENKEVSAVKNNDVICSEKEAPKVGNKDEEAPASENVEVSCAAETAEVSCVEESVAPATVHGLPGKKTKKSKKGGATKEKPQACTLTENVPSSTVSPEAPEKAPKRRPRNELDKLHEDIREMFISKDVVTATGQRRCRMRNESKDNKDTAHLPRSRPGSADEKLKITKRKFRRDDAVDSSDDSPTKTNDIVVDNTIASTEEFKKPPSVFSSDSEDDSASIALKTSSADLSPISFTRKRKKGPIESESDSDAGCHEEDSFNSSNTSLSQPLVVLEKAEVNQTLGLNTQVPVRNSRNVARRGRKLSGIGRDIKKVKSEIQSLSGEEDENDGSIHQKAVDHVKYVNDSSDEDDRIDKDMSQIDVSNIIEVKGVETKLTRNQLKKLQDPVVKSEAVAPSKKVTTPGKDSNMIEGLHTDGSQLKSKKRAAKAPSVTKIVTKRKYQGKSQDEHNIDETDSQHHKRNLSFESDEGSSASFGPLTATSAVDADGGGKLFDLDYVVTDSKIHCKLCHYNGKKIISHYVNKHPADEVLISRLPSCLASQLKSESDMYNKDIETLLKEFSVSKKALIPLQCLLCDVTANNSWKLFDHVSAHTGEYRYSCTMCDFKSPFKQAIKGHKIRHKDILADNSSIRGLHKVVIKDPSPMKVLLGYLCSLCNYFQLQEANVKKHLMSSHPGNALGKCICIRLSREAPAVLIEDDQETNDTEQAESLMEAGGENALSHPEMATEKDVSKTSCSDVQRDLVCATTNSIVQKDEEKSRKPDKENESSRAPTEAVPPLQTPQSSHEQAASESLPTQSVSNISVFLTSDQLEDKDLKLQEEREKLLKDAGEKIKNRPKLRSCISERLAQRLQSDLPGRSGDEVGTDVYVQNQSGNEAECLSKGAPSFVVESSAKASSRLTPVRVPSKPTDSSERRLTRSLSRTPISVGSADDDSQSVDAAEVPEEVKILLPASKLSDTLHRMQESMQAPVVHGKSEESLLNISPQVSLKMKNKNHELVQVGQIEAIEGNDSQNLLFNCRVQTMSEACYFTSTSAFLFMNHLTSTHKANRSLLSKCSVCNMESQLTLLNCFSHLVSFHLVEVVEKNSAAEDIQKNLKTNPPPAVPLTAASLKTDRIRVRRLPGDMLSTSLKGGDVQADKEAGDFPFVIASVVSLSKDHTPEGLPLGKSSPAASSPGSVGMPMPPAVPLQLQSNRLLSEVKDQCSGGAAPAPALQAQVVRIFPRSYKKDLECLKVMLTPQKLRHLYKCMGQNCTFTTNLKEKFAEHYQKHLLKELAQNPDAARAEYEWQRCMYCGKSKDSGEDLVDHVLINHSNLKYQCPLCLYRAAQSGSVVRHQELNHPRHGNEVVKVLECRDHSIGLGITPLSSSVTPEHIQPYQCAQENGCKRKFVAADNFMSHLKNDHSQDEIFFCNICRTGQTSPERLICHFSSAHSYRNYHCLHCSKAAETRREISYHMCAEHPEKETTVAVRTQQESGKSMLLSDNLRISLISVEDAASSTSTSLDHYQQTTLEAEETDISIEPALFDNELYSASDMPLKGSVPEGNRNKEKQQGDDCTEDLEIIDCTPSVIKPVNLNKGSTDHQPAVAAAAAAAAGEGPAESKLVLAAVKDPDVSGLTGSALFLCAYSGCQYKGVSSSALKDHILMCESARSSYSLSCPHCRRQFKQALHYMEHLSKHGIQKYFCSLCDVRATFPAIAIRHVKQKHKIANVQIVPLNPQHRDPDTALFSVQPKQDGMSKKGKVRTPVSAANKTTFGPEEVIMLPLSAVFTKNVSCSLCNYTTKVRSNMVRHLEQHASGRNVSSVLVVNPVPCLERSEKMFDTMTNHAISSTIPVRRDSNAIRVTDEPKFVPLNKRYVCCAAGCEYITSDDAMLRHHIRNLHPDILVYKCPHCPETESDTLKQSIFLEKLGSHLKMHDNRLYSCLSCPYYHYHRHIVERHASEKHSDQNHIKIIREPKIDGLLDGEYVDSESDISSTWKCELCEGNSFQGTRTEIENHAATIHGTRTQYKCYHCPFKSNIRARFSAHFANKHPSSKEEVITVFCKAEKQQPSDTSEQQPEPMPCPESAQASFDSTPLWLRGSPRVRHLRGILFDDGGLKPKDLEHSDMETSPMGSKRRAQDINDEDSQGKKRERREAVKPSVSCALAFQCPKCPVKYELQNEPEFRDHLLKEKHPNRYKCKQCPLPLFNYSSAEDHVLSSHQVARAEVANMIIDTNSEDWVNAEIIRQQLHLKVPNMTGPVIPRTPPLSVQSGQSPSRLTRTSSRSLLESPNTPVMSKPSTMVMPKPGGKVTQMQSIFKPATFRTSSSPSSSPPSTFQKASTLSSSSTPNVSVESRKGKVESELSINKSPVESPSKFSASEMLERRISGASISIASPSPASRALPLSSTESEEPENSDNRARLIQSVPVLSNNSDDDLVEVDESALEMDIEEIEEINDSEKDDIRAVNSTTTDLPQSSFPNKDIGSSSVALYPCEYRESHGCTFVAKTKADATVHMKKHWKEKPYKCGYCEYQCDIPSRIKLHSLKMHSSAEVKVVKVDMPAEPTIIPVCRKRKSDMSKKQDAVTDPSTQKEASSSDNQQLDPLQLEAVFKSIKVYRCCYCRLRDTSIHRLMIHWQNNHRHSEIQTFKEMSKDGRNIVPLKFREVKLGEREVANMAFRCALCARTGSIKLLAEHYPSRHPGQEVQIRGLVHDRLQCTICPKQFSNKHTLMAHFSTAHPGETVNSLKVKPNDNEDPVDISFMCQYCEDIVTGAQVIQHHLHFHSHLDGKYNEQGKSSPTSRKELKANTVKVEPEFEEAVSSGSVDLQANAKTAENCFVGEQENFQVARKMGIESDTYSVQHRAKGPVARKSTTKCRAVARKSTGGRIRIREARVPLDQDETSSSEGEDEPSEFYSFYGVPQEPVSFSRITCPLMISGTTTRVSVALLSEMMNLHPTVKVAEITHPT